MPTSTAPITPVQVHHSWVQILLEILQVSAAVAPLAAAPFTGGATLAAIGTESQLATVLTGALEKSLLPAGAD